MPQKIDPKKLRAEGVEPEKKVTLGVSRFGVDRAGGRLTDLAILTAGREAKGHGIYIDEISLETALASIKEKGDQLKAKIAHDDLMQWIYGKDRLMETPGWFSSHSISGNILQAGAFEFYESFQAHAPEAFAHLMEMAEKTPGLFGLSIEAWGYAVYVDEEGNEYRERPEDVDLKYEGMPAFRIVEIFAVAFVSDPAANDGLFAKALSSVMGRKSVREQFRATLAQLLTAAPKSGEPNGEPMGEGAQFRAAENNCENKDNNVPSKNSFQSSSNSDEPESTQLNNDTMNQLIKALRAKYKDDEARLSRALMLASAMDVADDADIEALTSQIATQVDFAIQGEELERLRKQNKDLTAGASRRESGVPDTEFDLGTPAIVGLGKKTGATAVVFAAMQERGMIDKNFAVTGVDDLWVPDVWAQGVAEMKPVSTDFFGSGVVVTSPLLDEKANSDGSTINVPNFQEPDHEDELQKESTGPSKNGLTSGKQIAVRLNRVNTLGAGALSAGLSGSDPVGFAQRGILGMRNRNRLRQLIAILRGAFGTDGTAAYAGLATRSFIENGSAATATHLWDGDLYVDATAKLGEKKSLLDRGVLLIHPDIEAALVKQDDISYIRPSEGSIRMKVYKDEIPVIVSSLLKRAGTTDGSVYDSYVFGPGTVGLGYRKQTNRVGDIASLVMREDEDLNENIFYDRTSGFLHPAWLKWVGTPADAKGGPTNAELQTAANWDLAAEHAENVGIVQIVTNG